MVDLNVLRHVSSEVLEEFPEAREAAVEYYASNYIAYRTEEFLNELYELAVTTFMEGNYLPPEVIALIEKKVKEWYPQYLQR